MSKVKSFVTGIVMLVGVIAIGRMLWPIFSSQEEGQPLSPAVQLTNAVKNRIDPQPTPPTPPRWSDVAVLEEKAAHERALKASQTSFTAIWSMNRTWPEAEWRTQKSPVIKYEGPNVTFEEDSDGSRALVLSGGCIKLQVKNENNDTKLIDLFEPLEDGWQTVYWDANTATKANYAVVIRVSGLPTELVPVTQRTSDGRAYFTKCFAYRDDIVWPGETQSLAMWARVKLRNSSEDQGRREVIDRYSAVLSSGQSTSYLSYVPEPLEEGEKQSGYKRGWMMRCGEPKTALRIQVNNDWYVIEPGRMIDTKESEKPDGSLHIKVVLCRDSRCSGEVPVEFVYYRYIEAV